MKVYKTKKSQHKKYLDYWSSNSQGLSNYIQFKKNILAMERKMLTDFAEMCKRYIFFNIESLLELGCGDGNNTFLFLSKLDIKITNYIGVDINSYALDCNDVLKQRGLVKKMDVYISDMNKFEIKTKQNIILALNSLYGLNIHNLNKFINILDEDGLFIILLNSRKGIFNKLSRKNSWPLASAEDYIKVLKKSDIRYDSFVIKYRFAKANDIKQLKWLKYLLNDVDLDDKIFQFYNSNLEEVEIGLVIYPN